MTRIHACLFTALAIVALSCAGSKKTSRPPGSDNPKPITSAPSAEDRELCEAAARCQVEMENEGNVPEDQLAAKTDECLAILSGKSPEMHDAVVSCTGACGDCMGYWDCLEMTDPGSPPCFSPEEEPSEETPEE